MNSTKVLWVRILLMVLVAASMIQQALGQTDTITETAGNVEHMSSTGLTWSDTTNMFDFDGQNAMVSAVVLGDTSRWIKLTNFGFSIPNGSTISGIEVLVKKHATGILPVVQDLHCILLKNEVATGNDKADNSNWPTTSSTSTYGDSSDLWGTTWTVSEINSMGFGVVFGAELNNGTILPSALVDGIKIRVHYVSPPLPLQLDFFRCTHFENNYLEFEWQTLSEIDVDYFELQYLWNGQWKTGAEVDANGNSNTIRRYEATMELNEESNPQYFRLKSVDRDGSYDYSDIILLDEKLASPSEKLIFVKQSTLWVHQHVKGLRCFNEKGEEVDLIFLSNDHEYARYQFPKINGPFILVHQEGYYKFQLFD